jgi:hypothetical protein
MRYEQKGQGKVRLAFGIRKIAISEVQEGDRCYRLAIRKGCPDEVMTKRKPSR